MIMIISDFNILQWKNILQIQKVATSELICTIMLIRSFPHYYTMSDMSDWTISPYKDHPRKYLTFKFLMTYNMHCHL